MAGLFHAEISLILGLVVYFMDHQTVSTISASDFEVKTIEVNSDVKFACVFDNTSLLTMLKYGQNSATEMSLLAYKYKIDKQFTVANESYTGRIAVHNSSRVVLTKVTVKDNGFYNCRIEHSSGKFEEDKVQLKIGVPPTIEPLSSVQVLEETLLKVVCNVHGLPAPDVVWYSHTSLEQTFVTSHVLEIKSIQISQSGLYYCSAENYMKKVEQSLQVKVLEKPSVREFYYVGPLDGVFWECEDVKMICEMAPNSSLRILNYRLYHEDKLITKQSNSGMFRISRVGLKDSGSYTCVPETHLALGRNKTLRLHVRDAPNFCKRSSTSSSEFPSSSTVNSETVSFTQPNRNSPNCSTQGNHLGSLFLAILSAMYVVFLTLIS